MTVRPNAKLLSIEVLKGIQARIVKLNRTYRSIDKEFFCIALQAWHAHFIGVNKFQRDRGVWKSRGPLVSTEKF